jgi:signal transduction histidine kinase
MKNAFSHLTIRRRILLTVSLMILIGGVLQLLIAAGQLQDIALEFFQHDLETRTIVIANAMAGTFEYYLEGEGRNQLGTILTNIQQPGDSNYTLIDSNKRIIADSDQALIGKQSPETPELRLAYRDSLGANIRDNRLYVAAPIHEENNLRGFLILSASLNPAYADAQRRWLELLMSTLPILVLGVAGSLWVGQTISRPIHSIHESALRMANGAFDTRLTIASRDELGELAGAFNFMAERLEEVLRSQRNFVSNAAHELRAPLMNLKLRAETLQEDVLDEEQHADYVGEINREVDHMAHLVTSLLVLARLDEGRHVNESIPEDCAALLQDITRYWRIQAQKVGLEFQVDFPSELPEVKISASDFRSILDNLLSNAFKYTPKGHVNLAVNCHQSRLHIRVSDTGIGFTPADGERLFERFFRVDSPHHINGIGLGLAITQSIIRYYGGTIRASSKGLGHGAVFEVELPLQ